jgi:hypothetical protein
MSGRISLALTVYLGVIFFQIMIVEALPRTNSFTTMHRFMFLSSVFNGIIVLEHVLVYALNALVGERAERVRRIQKLKKNAKAVRYAVRLQRSFRNHRIHVLHQRALSKRSLKVGASSPTDASTNGSDGIWPIAFQVDPADVRVRDESGEARHSTQSGASSSTRSGVDVGIARRTSRGHGHVGDVVLTYQQQTAAATSADTSAAPSSEFLQQLNLRMQMADKSFRLSCREQKRAIVRKLWDFAAIFLKDANRIFTIITMASYFIGVMYLVRAL